MKKKILVVAAHPDDEVLGCGGTILKYTKKGHIVHTLFISDGESSRKSKDITKLVEKRKKAALKASKLLGVKKVIFCDYADNKLDKVPLLSIVKILEKYIKKFNPKIIFTHHFNDLNIDHRIVSKAVTTACRPNINNSVELILFFEVLSSTEWQISDNKKIFAPNWYENISKEMLKKIKAIKFYKKEMRKYPHPRSIKSIKSLSQFRGVSSGYNYAEAFVLGRKR